MLRVDVLDAFQTLEAIAGTREERGGFEEISKTTGNWGCLERVMVGEELGDDIDAVGGNVAGCD